MTESLEECLGNFSSSMLSNIEVNSLKFSSDSGVLCGDGKTKSLVEVCSSVILLNFFKNNHDISKNSYYFFM